MSSEVMELQLIKCCTSKPIVKEKMIKKGAFVRHTIECEDCGLIIGSIDDFYYAVENWNQHHSYKTIINQIRKDMIKCFDISE